MGDAITMTAQLVVEDLRLRRGAREILRGISMTADRGEIVALMSLSGGGKTTTLRVIAGLERYESGTVTVAGTVGMVFQHHSLFEHLTTIENVTLAPIHVARTPRHEAEQGAVELLERLGVAHRRNAYPRELSGGEAQRVAIARAMAVNPSLLLMDEPTASLDPARRADLGATLKTLAADGRTLVVTTHDDEFAIEFASRAIILADGAVVEEGPARDVLTRPKHAATRLLLQSAHEGDR